MRPSPTSAARRITAALLALTLTAALASCGSDGADEAGPDDETAPAVTTDALGEAGEGPAWNAPPSDESAYPVTIEHALGSTTVDSAPKRIAAVGLTDQDVLIALGILPVLTVEWFGGHPGAIFPWAVDEAEDLGDIDDIVVLDPTVTMSGEQVAVADPDLIVGLYGDITQDQYDALSKIAPTIVQPEGPGYGISWQDQTLTMGTIVGKRDFAEQLVEDTEARIAEVRAAHPDLEGKTAIMVAPYEGIYVYGSNDPRGRVLEELGMVIPEELDAVASGASAGQLSLERADLLDLDAVIWLEQEEPSGSVGGPVYEALGLADAGREIRLDGNNDTFGQSLTFQTVLSYPFLLEGLADRLSAAVDGDPATTADG